MNKINPIELDLYVLNPDLLLKNKREMITKKLQVDDSVCEKLIDINEYYMNYNHLIVNDSMLCYTKPTLLEMELRAKRIHEILSKPFRVQSKLNELINYFNELLILDENRSNTIYYKEFLPALSELINEIDFKTLKPAEIDLTVHTLRGLIGNKYLNKEKNKITVLLKLIVCKRNLSLKYYKKKTARELNTFRDKVNLILLELDDFFDKTAKNKKEKIYFS